ncbi:MAG: carbohydrate porin, partial [cyanobacterium endosymbiont of Rhopalodia fuxianensis]
DNISITPGLILITSPDYDNSNNSLLIGTIRTTFTF